MIVNSCIGDKFLTTYAMVKGTPPLDTSSLSPITQRKHVVGCIVRPPLPNKPKGGDHRRRCRRLTRITYYATELDRAVLRAGSRQIISLLTETPQGKEIVESQVPLPWSRERAFAGRFHRRGN